MRSMRVADPEPGSPPLSGITVLDLSRVMAGPWATQILADLGADVIKIERPGSGDDTRSWGPPFLRDPSGAQTAESAYYLGVNRGKRSMTVDIKAPEGQEIIRSLAQRADILVENFKAGALAARGLGHEAVRALNPALIYCSITGFGQDGPRRLDPAYDFAIQAIGGLMSVTGEADGKPGGGPQKVGVPIVDLSTGLFAAVAILAALVRRDRTGAGEYIDMAMLDVQVAMLANQAMGFLVSGVTPVRHGNSHPQIQPQDVYECSDGALALAMGNDTQFVALCEVLGIEHCSVDARFAGNQERVRNLDALRPLLAVRFREGTRARWEARLTAAGVPCGAINSLPEVFADPQVLSREMTYETAHPLAHSVTQLRSPICFEEGRIRPTPAAPLLGADTEELLRAIGKSDREIRALRESGVV